jgi:hypothetical protein
MVKFALPSTTGKAGYSFHVSLPGALLCFFEQPASII